MTRTARRHPLLSPDAFASLGESSIGYVRQIRVFLLQDLKRFARLPQNVVFPVDEFFTKIGFLPITHEGLVIRGLIVKIDKFIHL